MVAKPNIVEVAALIGDASRVTMLSEMLGGKALPASELARIARITPQTASSHLAKLVEGGLLSMETSGRHRYYRLAGPEVAYALEALNAIATQKPSQSLKEYDRLKVLRYARTCYDHIAGEVGVRLTDQLLALGMIDRSGRDFVVSERGYERFRKFGIDVDNVKKERRHFARQCLDWSERRHHIAGSLGAAMTNRLFELEWIVRIPGGRAIRVTEAGLNGLANEFCLKL
ncbi:ArsR/SmtB family transcription factor [Paenibacillus sp. OAS669]|uniref:ArsR/SmtB family transcription factor n=1 Tax=Paenibacillus sp. OAS669 TaxID=2663821 RepID=UPI00178BF8C5|nr:metalloregulator ArsR/SmtB family transcription factor [Paenibacillus sp. OAS669]MBE1445851.1 DNA-binding transcriptional ArsR family regulator [Paenibacillus sp. OAS669]